MKRKNLIILCFSTLLFLVAIGFLEPEPQPNTEVNIPLSAVVKQEGRQEKITCWADAAGGYYLFLPGYAQLDSVSLQPQSPDVRIDGKLVEKGMSCENLSLDVSYSLSFDTSQGRIATVLTLMQSQNLPAIYVDTLSGSMELVHRDKGNQEQGTMRLYLPDGQLDSEGNLESVKGRGNSSWLQEKRPYSLTLHAEADLLGMGQAKNWILLANAMDPSHLRNKVAYDLAAKAGMAHSPESRWVDLYLNGEYAGVYLLSERNEIHSERLDLPLVGSFLVSRESGWRLISQNYPHIITDSGAALRIHDSGLTRTDLDEVWQSVENAILAEEGIDPVTGKSWQELIDMDSWVMEYLMGEVFGNVDAGTISAYFYKDGRDPSGKIYAGPVWDYNLAYGNCNFCNADNPEAWCFEGGNTQPTPALWQRLLQDPAFRKAVKVRYKELRKGILSNEAINGYIDGHVKLLSPYIKRHFEKYPELLSNEEKQKPAQQQPFGVPNMGGFPGMGAFPGMGGFPGMGAFPGMGGFPNMGAFPGMGGMPDMGGFPGMGGFGQSDAISWFAAYRVSSYEEEIAVLKQWLADRLSFLDRNIESFDNRWEPRIQTPRKENVPQFNGAFPSPFPFMPMF